MNHRGTRYEVRGTRIDWRLMVFFFFLFPFTAVAQEFGMHWYYSAQTEPTQQVWFKRSFHMNEPATKAVLSVASEGRCIIYVNGYNVSHDLFSDNPSGAIAVHDYQIENLLNVGTNTIAIWYSPVHYTHRQLYSTLSGQWESGGMFYQGCDEEWRCRGANAHTLPDGNEEIDGSHYVSSWKNYDWQEDMFLFSDWQPAALATGEQPVVVTFSRHAATGQRMQRILKRAKVSQSGRTLVYDFGQPVNGWVRVTMRGMKKGEVVEVNGLRYICKGGSDDQACRRFTTNVSGIARITLPAGRSRSNITRVEAISIGW